MYFWNSVWFDLINMSVGRLNRKAFISAYDNVFNQNDKTFIT